MEGTDAQGLLLHALSWQAYAGLYLGGLGRSGRATSSLAADELARRSPSEPPYFAQNLFGAIAVIGRCNGRHRWCSEGLSRPGPTRGRPGWDRRQQRDGCGGMAGLGRDP